MELKLLERVTAAAFGQRRKMLRQSLRTIGRDPLPLLEAAETFSPRIEDAGDGLVFVDVSGTERHYETELDLAKSARDGHFHF